MASRRRPSNEIILQQIRNGAAQFELSAAPISVGFFARIGPSMGGISPAMKKVEHYSVQKVAGDGRCMFRALVRGMAKNKGLTLSPMVERDDADDLRMAVKEVICDSDKERLQYEESLIAITVDESLKRYCQRIERSDFWGGESELLFEIMMITYNRNMQAAPALACLLHLILGRCFTDVHNGARLADQANFMVLSKLIHQPIVVYIPEQEHARTQGNGFIPIAEYGSEFSKKSRKGKQRMPVRLVYSGKNHYDLLV